MESTYVFIYLFNIIIIIKFFVFVNYLYNYFFVLDEEGFATPAVEGYNFCSGARTSKCGIRGRCHLVCASIEKRGKELV